MTLKGLGKEVKNMSRICKEAGILLCGIYFGGKKIWKTEL